LNLELALDQGLKLYPAELQAHHRIDRPRILDQLRLATPLLLPSGDILDVGGGFSAFAPALALAGHRVTIMDSYVTPSAKAYPWADQPMFAGSGVRIVEVDASGPDFAPGSAAFDLVTCIDSIEHWHRSPRRSLHAMMAALRPGGGLMIGVPNCVNLRKRLTVPFGHGKWSSMASWYDEPEFTSHVREPDVDDLAVIARDLGLQDVRIVGRNWSGYASPSRAIRLAARLTDRMLQLRPSLCSDLYLIGRKPGLGVPASHATGAA
jgi:SAM-dependent methyltransferase